MRGRNFWGPGFWKFGYLGYPYYPNYFGFPFWGRGRGNPFPFCRWFPFLPRGWWAMPFFLNMWQNVYYPYQGDVKK